MVQVREKDCVVLTFDDASTDIAEAVLVQLPFPAGSNNVKTVNFATDELFRQAAESADVIVATFSQNTQPSQNVLMEFWRILKPGSSLFLLLQPQGRTHSQSEVLHAALTLSGFFGTQVQTFMAQIEVRASKPKRRSDSLNLLSGGEPSVREVWNQSTSDAALIDDSQLLSEEDLSNSTYALDSICSETKLKARKACKNCTCGYNALENKDAQPKKPRITMDMLEKPAVNSSCGSCSLGDAFRCSGCPYRGLPPFRPGEKIILPDDFDYEILEN